MRGLACEYVLPVASQFSMELEVANLRDLRNSETIGLHLVVAAQPQHEGLLVRTSKSPSSTLPSPMCYTFVMKCSMTRPSCFGGKA